ncbi:MAG: MmcQ/YjbR family DNA-binding protein [Clostridia bacterium]|nr:MmcQ/YjbR family DNA-binding protein [Clostridia bacterium]
MKEIELKHKRIIEDKLAPFGFKNGEYSESIMNGQFVLMLMVSGGKLFTKLLETAFGDEYVLHLVPDAQGEFVGEVKSAYNSVLDKFFENCCETEVFQSEQSHEIREYARKTYGDELEFLWEKFTDDAVLRRKDSGCWYAAILTVSRAKLGFDSDEKVEVIDLRMRPENADMVDGKRYLAGYHMNKKSWFTIVLDGSVPTEEIFEKIDESYRLAAKGKKA